MSMKNLGIGLLIAAAVGALGAFFFSESTATIIVIVCIVIAFLGACLGNYAGDKNKE